MKKAKQNRKKADEREQMILLQAEHIGYWVMLAIALTACLVKGLFLGRPVVEYAWETLILLAGSIVMVFGCVSKGVFDVRFEMKPAVRLLYSVLAALGFTAVFCAGKMYQYPALIENGGRANLLPMAVIFWSSNVVLCYAAFSAAAFAAKRKKRRMDRELEDSGEEIKKGIESDR